LFGSSDLFGADEETVRSIKDLNKDFEDLENLRKEGEKSKESDELFWTTEKTIFLSGVFGCVALLCAKFMMGPAYDAALSVEAVSPVKEFIIRSLGGQVVEKTSTSIFNFNNAKWLIKNSGTSIFYVAGCAKCLLGFVPEDSKKKLCEFATLYVMINGVKGCFTKLKNYILGDNNFVNAEEIKKVCENVNSNTDRINEVDGRIDEHDNRINEVDGRIDEHDNRINEVDECVATVNEQLNQFANDGSRRDDEIYILNQKLKVLLQYCVEQNEFNKALNIRFANVYLQFAQLNEYYNELYELVVKKDSMNIVSDNSKSNVFYGPERPCGNEFTTVVFEQQTYYPLGDFQWLWRPSRETVYGVKRTTVQNLVLLLSTYSKVCEPVEEVDGNNKLVTKDHFNDSLKNAFYTNKVSLQSHNYLLNFTAPSNHDKRKISKFNTNGVGFLFGPNLLTRFIKM
jgi:hypothetical protein